VKIIIDSREPNSIISFFRSELPKDWELSVDALSTGDFICLEKSICIERKTLDDLISSIKDRRLFAQLERANSEFDHVFLLVSLDEESKLSFRTRSNFSKRALFGALASISNFASVFIAPDPELLIYLAIKLFEKVDRIKYHPKRGSQYLSSKQKIIDGAIRNIPRIGPTLSQEIASHFSSVADLIERFDELESIRGISEKRKKQIADLIF